jgi:16S rRNA (uracil1498-N3)-methyltransferase
MSGAGAVPHLLVDVELGTVGPGDRIGLAEDVVRHLRKVLRLSDGAALSLTDGSGCRIDARLEGPVAVTVAADRRAAAPRPALVLVQALSKGRRAEDAVRAACELGVDRIVPLVAGRTQGRPDAAGRVAVTARWQAVADAALEQSRSVHRSVVDAVVDIDGLGDEGRLSGRRVVRLVAAPGASGLRSTVGAVVEDVDPDVIAVAIGPEGGWTPDELALLVAREWSPVGLGATVLRTEHAGPAALAALAALTGRWESDR